MKIKSISAAALAFFLLGCGEPVTRELNPRILAMGDSLLAWNSGTDQTVSDILEGILGEAVIDRSVIGARFLYDLPISGAAGMNISKQYRPGRWDWVILNGGGNDLWFGCGCIECSGTINRMISKDGESGKIPTLVYKLRSSGARVVYVGYLHSPGVFSIIDHCKNEDVEFESRIAKLARDNDGVDYLRLADLVPEGDLSYHAADRIHPSVKGSTEIAKLISKIIQD